VELTNNILLRASMERRDGKSIKQVENHTKQDVYFQIVFFVKLRLLGVCFF
jgi:hypothetical protein